MTFAVLAAPSMLFARSLALSIFGFLPLVAQAQPVSPPLPAQRSAPAQPVPTDSQLKAQFAIGFTKGCLTSQGNTLANKPAFCSCVLNAYQSRYSGQALAAIVALASQAGPSGPRLVDLLMLPERNACIARTR